MTTYVFYIADAWDKLIGAFWHVSRSARFLALPPERIHILAASKELSKDCQLLLYRKRLGLMTLHPYGPIRKVRFEVKLGHPSTRKLSKRTAATHHFTRFLH